jgi:hypothetical protein
MRQCKPNVLKPCWEAGHVHCTLWVIHEREEPVQICRKGTVLLMQLASERRARARSERLSELATSKAQIDAQREWGGRMQAAKREAKRATENVKVLSIEAQKRALAALAEVRREVMSIHLGEGEAVADCNRIMRLEEDVQARELEVLEWQRALWKVRMWNRFREGSLQIHCAEVVRHAMQRVDDFQREKWETAEAQDLYSR